MRKLINRIILCIVLHLVLFASGYATDITLSPFQIKDLHVTGSTIKVRLYSSDNWTDSDGHQRLPGQAGSTTGAFQEIICSVSGTTATCPSSGTLIIPSTIDSIDRPNVRISASIFDEKNAFKGNLFQNWRIPSSPTTTTWRDLVVYNASQQRPLADTYATTQQVQNLIAAITPSPKATTVIHGIGRVYPTPVDVANPEFTGTNHPAILSATRWVNVKAYSVTGSGSDESTNLQLAATAAIGKVLYFPNVDNETYVFKSINIGAGTTVIADAGVTLQLKGSLTAKAVIFNVTGSNVTFLNLKIDGNKSNLNTASVAGYQECECYENNTIGGSGSTFWAGIKADAVVTPGLTDLRVEGCTFTNMFGASVVTTGVNRVRVINNVTRDSYRSMADLYGGTGTGGSYVWGTDAVVTGNWAINILRYNAFNLTGWDGLTFTGNRLRNVDRGMKVESGRVINISHNQFILTNTDYCDTTWAGLCNSSAGPAVQLTSNQTPCGYFDADGTTPQCGLRDVTMDDNKFIRSGGIGVSAGAGKVVGLTISNSIFDSPPATSSQWGVVIAQTAISYTAYRVQLLNLKMYNMPYRGIDIGTASGLAIRNCELNGGTGASQAIALNPGAADGGVDPTMEDITIADNDLTHWSVSGGAIAVFANVGNTARYYNLQIKGNNCNQGEANICVHADIDTGGNAAGDFIVAGSAITGNTFIGGIKVVAAGVYLSPDNRILASGMNFLVLDNLNASSVVFGQMTFQGSVTIDLPALTSDCDTFTIPVWGARTTDKNVTISADATGAGFKQVFNGHVSGNDVVTARRCTFGAVNPTSAVYTATIVRGMN